MQKAFRVNIERVNPEDVINEMIQKGWTIENYTFISNGSYLFILAHNNEGQK